jgi:hypothetical protein
VPCQRDAARSSPDVTPSLGLPAPARAWVGSMTCGLQLANGLTRRAWQLQRSSSVLRARASERACAQEAVCVALKSARPKPARLTSFAPAAQARAPTPRSPSGPRSNSPSGFFFSTRKTVSTSSSAHAHESVSPCAQHTRAEGPSVRAEAKWPPCVGAFMRGRAGPSGLGAGRERTVLEVVVDLRPRG